MSSPPHRSLTAKLTGCSPPPFSPPIRTRTSHAQGHDLTDPGSSLPAPATHTPSQPSLQPPSSPRAAQQPPPSTATTVHSVPPTPLTSGSSITVHPAPLDPAHHTSLYVVNSIPCQTFEFPMLGTEPPDMPPSYHLLPSMTTSVPCAHQPQGPPCTSSAAIAWPQGQRGAYRLAPTPPPITHATPGSRTACAISTLPYVIQRTIERALYRNAMAPSQQCGPGRVSTPSALPSTPAATCATAGLDPAPMSSCDSSLCTPRVSCASGSQAADGDAQSSTWASQPPATPTRQSRRVLRTGSVVNVAPLDTAEGFCSHHNNHSPWRSVGATTRLPDPRTGAHIAGSLMARHAGKGVSESEALPRVAAGPSKPHHTVQSVAMLIRSGSCSPLCGPVEPLVGSSLLPAYSMPLRSASPQPPQRGTAPQGSRKSLLAASCSAPLAGLDTASGLVQGTLCATPECSRVGVSSIVSDHRKAASAAAHADFREVHDHNGVSAVKAQGLGPWLATAGFRSHTHRASQGNRAATGTSFQANPPHSDDLLLCQSHPSLSMW